MNTTVGARPDGTGGAQLVQPPGAKRHVFISYAMKDNGGDAAAAEKVCAALEDRGMRCWMAPRDVRPGKEIGPAVIDALRESHLMVVIFSSGANESREVAAEVERAVRQGMPVVAFRIEEVRPSESLERFLTGRNSVDAWAPPLGARLAELVDAVKMRIGGT